MRAATSAGSSLADSSTIGRKSGQFHIMVTIDLIKESWAERTSRLQPRSLTWATSKQMDVCSFTPSTASHDCRNLPCTPQMLPTEILAEHNWQLIKLLLLSCYTIVPTETVANQKTLDN